MGNNGADEMTELREERRRMIALILEREVEWRLDLGDDVKELRDMHGKLPTLDADALDAVEYQLHWVLRPKPQAEKSKDRL